MSRGCERFVVRSGASCSSKGGRQNAWKSVPSDASKEVRVVWVDDACSLPGEDAQKIRMLGAVVLAMVDLLTDSMT